ncbi:unnamed protein product [Mycena citricolor]|uniref:Cyclin N-terminal domain-containing protein n=1 Tax=Mycena citricolor TaxID=2018698 RepID=A0AAD2GSL1_9AGAR|nr:unnamed protein product [Mycena citricolor]
MSSMTDYSSWSPASTSASGLSPHSPVHPASLVDPANHSSAILELLDIEFTPSVIAYIVECVSDTVRFALTRDSPNQDDHAQRTSKLPSYESQFPKFVRSVLSRAEVTPATVLVALVYIARARAHLSIAIEDWALERVFLGALIVASKFTQDSTLRNVHWALCTGVFGKRDIGRIEREFLEVLDWDLLVKEEEILAHWEGVMGLETGTIESGLPAVADMSGVKSESSSSTPSTTSSSYRHSHHHHRHPYHHPHHHHRHTVPELEPSSPTSTCSSSLPTPHMTLSVPETLPVEVSLPVLTRQSGKEEHQHHSRFGDLLHALHLPRIGGHHGHRNRPQARPISVSAA